MIQGLDSFPPEDIPTIRQVNVVHFAWDIMVGLGTLLFLLSLWYGASWVFKRDFPQNRVFLVLAASSGVLSIVALEAGWVVTEVGRQPWIVYEIMRVEDAVTTNDGVWITFLAILGLYLALGVTTILVLRAMSRRFRAQDELGGGFVDDDVPYGPVPSSTPGSSHEGDRP